jgi:hypothetical protein
MGKAARLTRHAVAAVPLVLAAGCAAGTTAGDSSKSSPGVVDAGVVGKLPPAPGRAPRGTLNFPRGVVRVPGAFPLGSTVHFRVPVRNDGVKTLWLKRAESG